VLSLPQLLPLADLTATIPTRVSLREQSHPSKPRPDQPKTNPVPIPQTRSHSQPPSSHALARRRPLAAPPSCFARHLQPIRRSGPAKAARPVSYPRHGRRKASPSAPLNEPGPPQGELHSQLAAPVVLQSSSSLRLLAGPRCPSVLGPPARL
jgi:hypothetical protein